MIRLTCGFARPIAAAAALSAAVAAIGCVRGTLPPREFYRLTPAAPRAVGQASSGPAPLAGAVAVAAYDTPGIYASGGIAYRVGATQYGVYPSREWAIPLGEMLGALTEGVLRDRGLTTGRVIFKPSPGRSEQYVWRGAVREFDEVDSAQAVSASVALAAQLVRVADDSVIWSGSAHEVEAVQESRSMSAVVAALSAASARALARLADSASAALRRAPAAGAQAP